MEVGNDEYGDRPYVSSPAADYMNRTSEATTIRAVDEPRHVAFASEPPQVAKRSKPPRRVATPPPSPQTIRRAMASLEQIALPPPLPPTPQPAAMSLLEREVLERRIAQLEHAVEVAVAKPQPMPPPPVIVPVVAAQPIAAQAQPTSREYRYRPSGSQHWLDELTNPLPPRLKLFIMRGGLNGVHATTQADSSRDVYWDASTGEFVFRSGFVDKLGGGGGGGTPVAARNVAVGKTAPKSAFAVVNIARRLCVLVLVLIVVFVLASYLRASSLQLSTLVAAIVSLVSAFAVAYYFRETWW